MFRIVEELQQHAYFPNFYRQVYRQDLCPVELPDIQMLNKRLETLIVADDHLPTSSLFFSSRVG